MTKRDFPGCIESDEIPAGLNPSNESAESEAFPLILYPVFPPPPSSKAQTFTDPSREQETKVEESTQLTEVTFFLCALVDAKRDILVSLIEIKETVPSRPAERIEVVSWSADAGVSSKSRQDTLGSLAVFKFLISFSTCDFVSLR